MEKDISFQIESESFQGKIIYGSGNKIEIKCSPMISDSNILQNKFEEGTIFNLNGKIKNKKFTAINCFVREGIDSFFYIVIEKNKKLDYKINIGNLYIGVSNIDNKIKNIKKCNFKISHQIPFLINNKQVYIPKHNFNIKFDKNIIIEFKNSVSLDDLNQILFDLKIFFQILVLNKDIEIIKKYFYLEDEIEIEEIRKYEKNFNRQQANYLIDNYNNFDIDKNLKLWFEAKEKYGKIFSYLSGILKENTLNHIEFKLFALSQWVEVYSTALFETNDKEKDIKKDEKELKKLINDSDLSDEAKNNLIDNWHYDTKGHTFVEKLKQLFKKNDFFSNLFNENKNLIEDIKYYRNKLTHLNVKDNLNSEQMVNLYEILKNLIYLYIMDELELQDNSNYHKFKKEANHFYKKYENLSKLLKSNKGDR